MTTMVIVSPKPITGKLLKRLRRYKPMVLINGGSLDEARRLYECEDHSFTFLDNASNDHEVENFVLGLEERIGYDPLAPLIQIGLFGVGLALAIGGLMVARRRNNAA